MVQDMKEVKIDYKPPEIFLIRMLAVLIWVLLFFLGIWLFRSTKLIMIYCIAVCIPLLFIVIFYCGFKKTVVRYDENRISWRWFWLKYDIDMAKVKSFSRAIRWNPAHRQREYWAEIRFRVGCGENEWDHICLRELAAIGLHTVRNMTFHDEEITEIYEYYAALYPEKAKGEVKYDKYCI